ncbi:Nucleoside-diphosphate-sugar epimerase [Archangium gephyra]|uniref:Nucleoside-diphosphate-sugar epimerase n=1 Tax=Archangium gephyra TaxID=48 RepID=A0AAC8Q5H9_9BACT|nr:Nucleoside-diphosphate-sugar epimerase [Archangium gephyra]
MKDEAKETPKTMGFEPLVILQPSLLLGEHAKSRPGERAAIVPRGCSRP